MSLRFFLFRIKKGRKDKNFRVTKIRRWVGTNIKKSKVIIKKGKDYLEYCRYTV